MHKGTQHRKRRRLKTGLNEEHPEDNNVHGWRQGVTTYYVIVFPSGDILLQATVRGSGGFMHDFVFLRYLVGVML